MPTTTFGNIQATIGGITFGSTDSNGVQWRLTKLAGWGSPASTVQFTQKPRGHGAFVAIPPYLTPRTLAPEGTVWAPSFDAASAAWDELCAAFSLTPTLLTVVEDTRSRSMMVQRQDETLPQWETDQQFSFSAQVVAADPRKMGTPLTAQTALPSTTGGLTVPFTVPFAISATTVTGQINLTNPGNIAGPVTMRVDGPCTGPIITHVSTGNQLVLASSLVIPAGQFLTIDMENQSVLAQGQASRAGYITSPGWSEFDPGSNQWSFTAVGYDPAAKLTVTATPAWQ